MRPASSGNLPSPRDPSIDGSNIPSTIDFSPALQQLMNQTGVPPANGNGSDSSPLQNLVDETQPTGNEDPSASAVVNAGSATDAKRRRDRPDMGCSAPGYIRFLGVAGK